MRSPTERLPDRVVLVVDDEDIVRRITARLLTEAGLRVLEARDGEEAVTLLASLGDTVVGVVVSDIQMPRMTGLELAGSMAQRWPAIPIILMSGQGGPPAGYPGPYFAKPFEPETLVAAVAALASASEQHGAPV